MADKKDYDDNLASLLKYTGNYSNVDIASLVYAGEVAQLQESFGDSPDLSSVADSASVAKIAKSLMSLTPRNESQGASGKFTKELIDEIVSIQTQAGAAPAVGEELGQAIRITTLHPYPGDKEKLKYFINGPYLHGNDNPNFYDLNSAIPLKCHTTTDFIKPDSIGGIPSIGTGASCSVIEILKPGFGPTSRDTKEVAAFTSIANSLEMSRCVPYFKVDVRPPRFIHGDDTADSQQKGTSIETPPYFNIVGFLRGDRKEVIESIKSLKYGADEALTLSMGIGQGQKPVRLSMGGGGMELFTTPQTMLTERSNLPNFTAGVLDRMRPFMSITSAKITTNIVAGWNVYKSATLELVLHDRSRMNLIAPFLRPEIFAGRDKTTFYLEYGWSHPDGTRTANKKFINPIGAFLHSLRVREAYEVYNVSYNFGESGQVNINLQLVSKSQVNVQALDTSITEVRESIRTIDELVKSINKNFNSLEKGGVDTSTLKSAFPEVLMGGVGSADAALSMNLEKYTEIKDQVDKLVKAQNSENAQIATKMQQLLQSVKQAQDNASSIGLEKIEKMFVSPEIFPIAFDQNGAPQKTITIPPGLTDKSDKETIGVTKKCISLGKVLYSFVAAPLASTRQFAEVQLIFHTHNKRASFMRSLSIARHPLDYEELKAKVTDFVKRKPKMSIGDFIAMLNENFLSNDSSFAYGFSKFMPKKDDQKVDAGILDKQSAVINKSGLTDGTYMKPSIAMYTECVMGSNSQPILRIHVTDVRSIAHQNYIDMMRNSRETSSKIFSSLDISPNHPMSDRFTETSKLGSDESKFSKYLQDKGVSLPSLNETAPSTGKVDDKKVPLDQKSKLGDAKSVKKLVSKGMPTIRYGQGAGAISNIGVSSMSDPALTTVALTAGGQSSALDPGNADQLRGIPMRITPAEMSVDMVGCPLLLPMQSFFVDLDTMTSLDGIYTVSTVDHSISPGSFTTSAKLLNTGDAYATFRSYGTDAANALSLWLNEDAQKRVIEEEERKKQADEKKKKDQKSKRDEAKKRADEQANQESLTAAEKTAAKDVDKKLEKLWKSYRASLTLGLPFRESLQDAMGKEFVKQLSDNSRTIKSTGTSSVYAVTQAIVDGFVGMLNRQNYGEESPDYINMLSTQIYALGTADKIPYLSGSTVLVDSLKRNASKVDLSGPEAALSEYQSAYSSRDSDIKAAAEEIVKNEKKA